MNGYYMSTKTGWHATYVINPDGTIVAHIVDNNGQNGGYGQVFNSVEELQQYLDSK